MNFPFRVISRKRYKALRRSEHQAGEYALQIKDLHDNMDCESPGEEPQIIRSPVLDCLNGSAPFDVLDIGANNGDWALSFARRFPRARIHCIEADARTSARLKENLAQDKNLIPYNMACSSREGTITFYSHDNPLLSSMLDLPGTGGKTRQVSIRSVTVDNFISAQSISELALLKIDTEGADLDVIQGSDAALKSPQLKFVILEFGIGNEDARHVKLNRLIEAMTGYDFYLASIGGFGLDMNYIYANALFARWPAGART